jgi:putative FmdB family regulatory protein
MPTYDYKCADCSHPFEVVKSMSQLDEMESCPSCLASCDKRCRLITKGKEFFGEKPDEPYFSSALGKWVKGKKDESKQAKERGWIEVGNQSVEKTEKEYQNYRDRKASDRWSEFTNPNPYRVRGA